MDQAIPVICERCRVEGAAGDDPFSHLADLLSFTPVPRRAHANGWSAEHQRAFIAALAVTGSAPRAARAIGRHAFGAEQLRRAKGGASFAAAWDAAIDLCRERELSGLRDSMTELAAHQQADAAQRRSLIVPAFAREDAAARRNPDDDDPGADRPPPTFDRYGNQQFTEADGQDYLAGMNRIQQRLTQCRRLLLASLVDHPAKRAAWETLVGPVDWNAAERLERQADEPFDVPGEEGRGWQMRRPDMLMVVDAGLVPDLTGGRDGFAPIRAAVEVANAAIAGPPGAELPPEQAEAIAAYRAALIAEGWTEDGNGGLIGPEEGGADLKAPAAERRGNVGGGWTEDGNGGLIGPDPE